MARRLDVLEARLGVDTDDFGPHVVVRFTRRWRPSGPEDAESTRGEAVERERIDQALEALRAEARARRIHVQACFARIHEAGGVELSGIPWLDGGRMVW